MLYYKKTNVITDILAFITFIAVVIVIMGPILILTNISSNLACQARWLGSKYESGYSLFGGCKVKLDGSWVPEDNLKFLEEKK